MTRPDASQTSSVGELEEEIARTRARLSHGLAVLDREYALRHLLVRGTRLLREPEFRSGIIAKKARQEIVPLALIGVGLAWLVLGRKEGGDLFRRLSDGWATIPTLAREFLALFPTSRAALTPALTDTGEPGGEDAPRRIPAAGAP